MSSKECRLVAEQIHAFLDGELDEVRADRLRLHIDVCEECLAEADFIDALKRLVRRSCSQSAAPAALRARIITHITTVSLVATERPETPR